MMARENNYEQTIIDYYNTCWLERFRQGHNPLSQAMHMGYFETAEDDNDIAKVRMNRFLVQKLGLKEGDSKIIVDAGCGIGGTVAYLNSHFPNLNLIGINLSSEQIAFAGKKNSGNENVRYLQEDYSQTSIKSGEADIVYAIESLCHASSKEGFFFEAFRILKPGGTLLVLDYVQTSSTLDEETKYLVEAFETGWAVNNYLLAPELLLSHAGFDHIEIESILKNVMPGIAKSYEGALRKAEILNGHANDIVKKHLSACIALKELATTGAIDYSVIKCRKPLH